MWSPVLETLPRPSGSGPAGSSATSPASASSRRCSATSSSGRASVFYPWYRHGQPNWGITALHDQNLAGIVMMAEGGLVTLGALAWLFLRLAEEGELRQELIEQGLDPAQVARAVRYGRGKELAEAAAPAASACDGRPWNRAAGARCSRRVVEGRPLDERELVLRAQRGDERAFEELVRAAPGDRIPCRLPHHRQRGRRRGRRAGRARQGVARARPLPRATAAAAVAARDRRQRGPQPPPLGRPARRRSCCAARREQVSGDAAPSPEDAMRRRRRARGACSPALDALPEHGARSCSPAATCSSSPRRRRRRRSACAAARSSRARRVRSSG